MNTEASQVLRQESFESDNPVVYIETVSGSVTIVESSDSKSYVEISAKSENVGYLAEQVEISVNKERLSIRSGKRNGGLKQLFSGRSNDLFIVVKLPKTATLKVNAVSADIKIDQMLVSLNINSVSGNIATLQNPSNTCALKSVSGDITAHTHSSCRYSLKSVSGDISVRVAPGLEVDVDGKSVSGDLESEISLSTYMNSPASSSEIVYINASTVSGDFSLARS